MLPWLRSHQNTKRETKKNDLIDVVFMITLRQKERYSRERIIIQEKERKKILLKKKNLYILKNEVTIIITFLQQQQKILSNYYNYVLMYMM